MRICRLAIVPLLAGIAWSCCGTAGAEPAAPFFIRDGDRVVFYGDSITDTEWYPTLVQTFVLTRHPQWRNEFFNRGQSGDNTSSLNRFARDVVAQKPNALTFMMGYNDAGYRRLDSAGLKLFAENVDKSVAMARETVPAMRIMLVSSTPNELAVSSDNRWVSHDFYPYNLLMYSQQEARLATKLGVGFVDMTALYGQTLGLGRVMAGPAFALSRDGVHPQQEGQTFIAYHLLCGMKADSVMAEVAIDAKAGKAARAERCKVSDLKTDDGAISFTRICESLPYPTPEVARPFSFLVQLDDTLTGDRLVVTGLDRPSYELWVDNRKIADVPASALAEGINLSRFPNTSMYKQAMAVMAAVRAKDLLDCQFWRSFIAAGKADGNGNPLDDAARKEVTDARQKLAAAREACYKLNTPKAHTISLRPLDKTIAHHDQAVSQEINQAFLDASLTPLSVDWTTQAVIDGTTKVKIVNPNTLARSGCIRWQCPGRWTVTPAAADFTVEAGKSVEVPFTAICAGGKLAPTPTAVMRWQWSRSWPYPMTKELELELRPRWVIGKSRQQVAIDGKLDDWPDAVAFTLDDVHFIDPAVTGKRALWNGPEDLSVKWLMKWDEAALYLAAVVRDDEHVQNSPPYMMWSQDMLQVAAFVQEKGQPDGRYELGFGVYPDRDAVVTYTAPKAAESGKEILFKSALNAADHTCTYEIAIPWNRLTPFAPAEGKTFRFTFTVGEADSQPGKGYNYLSWTPGIAYGKNPDDFATIVLGK